MSENSVNSSRSSSTLKSEIVEAFQSLLRVRLDVYGQPYDESDLAKLLNQRDINPEHLSATREWLGKHQAGG